MSKESIFEIFLTRFRSEIEPERLFVYKYNSLFHVLDFEKKLDLKQTVEFFRNRFNLSQEAFLHTYETISEPEEKEAETIEDEQSGNEMIVLEDESKDAQVILELPERIIVSIEPEDIKFVFPSLDQADFVRSLVEQLPQSSTKFNHKHKFYMIYYSRFENLSLKSFRVKNVNVSIDEYYNDDFAEVDQEIKDFLMDTTRDGIVLLHGAVGTGKTTYLRHLMRSLDKRFIFLPPALAHKISSPEIIDFMSMLSDSVLIMEDCEDLIKPRGSSHVPNDALVNLLNLGDGLLADALNIKIICTFNADVHKIDSALMRKGRLAVEYEFRPLEVEKARKLAKKLGVSMDIKQPIPLAELFIQKQIVKKSKRHKPLGFQNN